MPLINSWRYYLEDRIENEFDAAAKLASTLDGTMHVRISGINDPELNEKLHRFAEQCVKEFVTNRM